MVGGRTARARCADTRGRDLGVNMATEAIQLGGMPTHEGDLSIEGRGIEPIPESARYGSVNRVFTVWFTPNLVPAAFFIGLGDAPIERAEIYFLDAARGMVERSDWLVPYYRGQPFYDKPALTYWLLALSFDLFGPSLFAGRLVAGLLALAALLATWTAARRLIAPLPDGRPSESGSAAAFFATTILGTSYAFVSFARLTMSDMLLTLLTLAAGALYLRSELANQPRLLVLCGTVLGLGFMTKGPIAWIFFGALLLAVALIERRVPRIFNPMGFLGTVAAFVVGLVWLLFVYLREGIEPLKWFFLRENFQRFAARTYDAAEPFWFYLPVYAAWAAAGGLSAEQTPEEAGWEEVPEGIPVAEGMFVVTVRGRSMEPLIPDGSRCVFREPKGGSRQGKVLLVERIESGVSELTVKVYSSEKQVTNEEGWEHKLVRMTPLNPEFEPWELRPGEFLVRGEFVAVLPVEE